MVSLAETLKLDPELVERVSKARMGFARALSKQLEESPDRLREDLRPWVASEYVRAASLAALWDVNLSTRGFREAASIYRELKNDFWIILALCSGGDRIQSEFDIGDSQQSDPTTGRSLPKVLLAYYFRARWSTSDDRFHRSFRDFERHARQPVTQFEIPLGEILESLDEAGGRSRTNAERMNSTLGCMRRMNEPLSLAMSDRYHWQRLQSPVLPVEPDFLAFCVVLVRQYLVADRSIDALESRVREFAPAISVTLDVAADIARF